MLSNTPVWFRLLFVLAVLLPGGCATYSDSFKPIEREIIAHRPAKALQHLEKQKLSGNDRLLHLLNKAMLLRMMGDYKGSNAHFEQAKKYIEQYAATSVTEQASSFLVNDSTRAFIGAPFEQVMIHLFSALNYLQLNEIDSARVEALQVDVKLRQLSSEDKSALLTSDPFARYLSGIIYEDLHEWSDALIAYRKAYEAYQGHAKFYPVTVPPSLKNDLLRLTDYEGLRNERDKYKKAFAINKWQSQQDLNKQGEVVLIMHNGLAPIMREHSVAQAGIKGQIHRISLPYYEIRNNGFGYAVISANSASARTEAVEDINHIAEKTLAAYMPKLIARSLARVIVKHKTAEKAGDQHALAGLLMNIANVATEVADTRSWLTLPGEIHLSRLPLAPGTYTIDLKLLNHAGQIIQNHQYKDVKVKRGRKTYLSHHWVSPAALRRK